MANIFPRQKLKELASKVPTSEIIDNVEVVKRWFEDYETGTLKTDKETSREQAYNQDFFIKVLGYDEKPSSPYSFEPKPSTSKGELPDAIVGHLTQSAYTFADQKVSAVVELKGASVGLDKPQKREGNMSPVQQGFKYKPKYKYCPFVIVSNFYEFRLYQDNQLDYEVWTLEDLCDEQDEYINFKTFYLLLNKANFVAPEGEGKSATEELLSDIRTEQEEIGKDFYKVYKNARLELLRSMWRNNERVKIEIDFGIEKAQKIIDRVVFACFAEDRGLLPDDTLRRLIKNSDESFGTLWASLKGFFEAIDIGSERLEIPIGYNGGLFAEDSDLNALLIDDQPLRALAELSNYDFAEQLSVQILGHIFEQSITDLEEIKEKAEDFINPTDAKQEESKDEKVSKRKKDGIFYTPDYIVKYIVDNSLGEYLRQAEERFKSEAGLKGEITDKNYNLREKKAYGRYQDFLKDIKVCDPACGSGAFLVQVFDYLLEENKRVAEILDSLYNQDEFISDILHNNIYGVDLNEESVEISKLSLWLKSAKKGRPLTSLSNNIKCGNSLIDDISIAGERAFNWELEFPEIFANGGFDIVVMNPPYVDSEAMTKFIPEQRKFLTDNYKTTTGNWDLYIPFFERAVGLTKENGYASFITPDKWVSKDFGYSARKSLLPMITQVVVAGREVFDDAKVDSIITTISKRVSEQITVRKITKYETFETINTVEKTLVTEPYTIDHLFSSELELVTKFEKLPSTLADYAECEGACSTADTYKLKDLISDSPIVSEAQMKMINTGTIGRYVSRWGEKPMTYLKDKYEYPVVDIERFKNEFGNSYYRKSLIPKLIVKGLTLLDACIDADGSIVPGKSTLIIHNKNIQNLYFLLAVINSKIPIFYIKRKYSSASYNGGINFTKDMVNNLPLPVLDKSQLNWFAESGKELHSRTEELNLLSKRFKDLMTLEFQAVKWSKKMEKWWSLDFVDFVKTLKLKLSITRKDQLLTFYEEYRPKLMEHDVALMKIEDNVNKKLYQLFNLTPEEIEIIENP